MSTVYASDSAGRLWALATETRLLTLLGTTTSPMLDIAMRADGTLFGCDGGSLYILGITAGGVTTTRVGTGGGLAANALEFDSTGTLYGLSGSTLVRINTVTGQPTSVGTIGGFSAGDLFFLGGDVYASVTTGDLVRGSLATLLAGGTTQVVEALGTSSVFGLAATTSGILAFSDNDVTRLDGSLATPLVWARDILPAGGSFYGATVEPAANASLAGTPPSGLMGTTTAITPSSSRIAYLGDVGDTGVFRVDLRGIATDAIRSIAILDDNVISGGTGGNSGFDLDFINYSTSQVSSASAAAALPSSPTFSFTADHVSLTAGFMRPWASSDPAFWNTARLFGTLPNGQIDLANATLSSRDGVKLASTGAVSLGEGGRLDLSLASAISGGFLYVGDVGGGTDGFAILVSSGTSVGLGSSLVLIGTSGDDSILLGQGASAALGAGADVLDGNSGNDTLAGATGDDVLAGGSGADSLLGQDGNDFLEGGTGNDTVNGGGGHDAAIFSGNRSAYAITSSGGRTWTVVGPDGSDLLTDIELARFADGTMPLLRPVGNYNGDATSDILFQNANSGLVLNWQMSNGGFGKSVAVAGAGSDWKLRGTGDFDGDGTTDILFQNTASGLVLNWQMSNGGFGKSIAVAGAGSDWKLVGTGDFNGDGTTDILFQHSITGLVLNWQMSNGGFGKSVIVAGTGSDWKLVGTGDFNGDGITDILFQNTNSGLVLNWQMVDGGFSRSVVVAGAGSDWKLAGTGDFNGDGTTDILFQNASSGLVLNWQMANGSFSKSIAVAGAGSEWKLMGTGDFNGDGTTDILFQNSSTGLVLDWQMSNGGFGKSIAVAGAAADWALVG